ncbi:MAG: RluA family pseudouridine synthase [Hungatella sp.]|jgi:23S rRNA pseudouridine1911/1915/1917 synthase|nr:RluA family pseudouridine synthase [Hungatella sp.]MCI9637366.1 RluA family pseudouridine synthase [Hungatella sp.]
MKKILTYPITAGDQGLCIRQYLQNKGYSRHLLIGLKKSPEGILLNGERAHVDDSLKNGDALTIQLEEEGSSPGIVPTPMDLCIVYEDPDLLVINKPAGLPVHPSQGHYDHTLANGLAWYFQQKGEPFVYRAVSRLDRNTSGLLLLARHKLSACLLSDMVQKHLIRRQYQAVVKGLPPCQGTVIAPISRVPGSTIQRQVDLERGEYACTHYRLLHYNQDLDCSLVALTLETGRTHQIRVHMSHIGHPVLGDFLYYPDFSHISRQSLHSCRLTLTHPFTGQKLVFLAPLPEDMRFVLQGSNPFSITSAAPWDSDS